MAAALTGCTVSPQPTPPGERPVISPEGFVGVESITELFVGLSGLPGTVRPGGGVVIATDLETTDEPATAPVADDGSFTVGVNTIGRDEIRIQAENEDGRSDPFDAVWDRGSYDVPRRPRALCLFVEPATHAAIGPNRTLEIVVRSECVDDVAFRAPRFRRGTLGFDVTPADAFELATGESHALTVRAPSDAGAEDVLFVETLDDPSDRRPITLYTPSTDPAASAD
ncbi:MAG: hypothetical protein IT379_05700 [Deltaproteobacteria bacterium]|nr:hypothetical protein [Deltaproteobacteria bacterium]